MLRCRIGSSLSTPCYGPVVSQTGNGLDLAGAAAGHRRLIAIVYADMVSYSRLIGLDDAGTFQRLRALRHALIDPTINEFGGTVVLSAGRVRHHRCNAVLRGPFDT